MKKTSPLLSALSALLVIAAPAAALDVETSLTCPDAVPSGVQVSADVRIENRECTALTGRIMASYVGNVGGTLDLIGVFGPKITGFTLLIPAATDLLPGTCNLATFLCDGSSGTVSCFSDADCECEVVTPGSAVRTLSGSPPTPAALEGTVATYIVRTEVQGTETIADDCLIALPEPSQTLQLATGLIGLLTLARRRAGRKENSR